VPRGQTDGLGWPGRCRGQEQSPDKNREKNGINRPHWGDLVVLSPRPFRHGVEGQSDPPLRPPSSPRRARHSGPQVSLGRRVLNSGQRADASAARHPRRGVLARHRRRVETAFSGNRDWPGSPVPEEGAPAGWERLNWKRTPRARAVASSQQASGCDGSPDPQSRRSGARGDGGIGGGVTAETRHTADSPPSMRST